MLDARMDDHPEHLTCSNCGAENPATAPFCWRCYAPFGHLGVRPTTQTQGPATTAQTSPPATRPAWTSAPIPAPPPPSPRRGPKAILIGTVIVVVSAALAGWWFTRERISLPDAFNGVTRYTSPQTDAGVERFHSFMDSQGLEGDLAFYGVEQTPRSALIWIKDPSHTDTEAAFKAFASGFGPALGGDAVDTQHINRTPAGALIYLCAPVSGAIPGAVCFWRDDQVFWILFEAGADATLDSTRHLATEATAALA